MSLHKAGRVQRGGGTFVEAAVVNRGSCPVVGVRLRPRVVGAAATTTSRAGAMSQQLGGATGGEERFTELVVVRHGETDWNASRIVQGQMDPEPNETGRQQSVVVASRLSREAKPAAIYSSDLKRAAETAQIIAQACGVSNQVVLHEALRERHMGCLQGMKWDDAHDFFRGFELTQGSDPDSRSQQLPGGGESLDQVAARCVSYLNKIAQQHTGERVVVVSHGTTIQELCRHADPSGCAAARRSIPNASLHVFRVSSATGQWALEVEG